MIRRLGNVLFWLHVALIGLALAGAVMAIDAAEARGFLLVAALIGGWTWAARYVLRGRI